MMPGIRKGIKGKWEDHKPEINRSNIKNPKSWVGKGGDGGVSSRAQSHQSAPLSSLQDPASFAPPPKHIQYHGADAASSTTQLALTAPSEAVRSRLVAADPPPGRYDDRHYDTDSGGLGGGLSRHTLAVQDEQRRRETDVAQRPKSPPKPFKIDSTGLSTTNLPPPPRRNTAGGDHRPVPPARTMSGKAVMSAPPPPPRLTSGAPPPPSRVASNGSSSNPGPAPRLTAGRGQSLARGAQPALPPRLPSRQNTSADQHTPPGPSATDSTAKPPPTSPFPPPQAAVSVPNTAAVRCLAGAAVSVPGLGVGRPTSPPSRTPTSTRGGLTSVLSSRFASLSHRPSDSTGTLPTTPGLESHQSQIPLSADTISSTLSSIQRARQDPSAISLAEARAAASTATQVERRHGSQIRAGVDAANRWAGQMQRPVGRDEHTMTLRESVATQVLPDAAQDMLSATAAKKKPAPPPPPAKKFGLAAGLGSVRTAPVVVEAVVPPPVPIESKPRG